MVYELTYTKRGEVTDDQKEDLLRKLKIKVVKEKEKGRSVIWRVKGKDGITTEDLVAVLRKFKVSKEMKNAEITPL